MELSREPPLERYRAALPLSSGTRLVSLGEGGTPLLQAPRLSERLGFELWLKLESANPTGSFKDRGMAVAVTRAVEAGAEGLVCASTGNTAASAAAYAARAGLAATVVHSAGAVAAGKLLQIAAAGARLVAVEGGFETAFAAAAELVEREGHVLVNSTNPDRLEGQKTAAFELLDQLGGPPDVLLLPYGGGGNTVAYCKGFAEAGDGMPRIVPVEAADRAGTFASAIRIAQPVHRDAVGAALERSGGSVVTVADDAIVDAWRLLAREEGIICEAASAAALAGAVAGAAGHGERVVCVLTGHGLKDADALARIAVDP